MILFSLLSTTLWALLLVFFAPFGLILLFLYILYSELLFDNDSRLVNKWSMNDYIVFTSFSNFFVGHVINTLPYLLNTVSRAVVKFSYHKKEMVYGFFKSRWAFHDNKIKTYLKNKR
jgi:hypothetical protein